MGHAQLTLPARFFANAQRYRSRIAHYYQRNGRWFPMGWETMAHLVRDLMAGLMALGHAPSDPVAIVSETRREWLYWDLAILAAGGISVGIYANMDADACRAILKHSDARFCVVENTKQLDKVRNCMEQDGPLKAIIVIDGGDVDRTDPRVWTHELVLRRGREAGGDVGRRVAALTPQDAAMFLYTCGTTAPPKAVMLTHGNIAAALTSLETAGLTNPEDTGLSFLPLAHPLQRVMDYYRLWTGMQSAYARNLQLVFEDFDQVRPTVITTAPHLLERLYGMLHEEAERSSAVRRLLAWARDLSKQGAHDRRGEVPASLQAQLRVARRLVFNRLHNYLGGRVRLIITGGTSTVPDIIEFYEAAGIAVIEGWGMAETFSAGTLNVPLEDRRTGSIGRPLPNVELMLAPDGEILIRGDNVFAGYYKADVQTQMAFTPDGFFRTGDIARIDSDGYYYLIDRKCDLIATASGDTVAPRHIETLIKADPRISQVVVFGAGRPYLVALVSVSETLRTLLDEAAIHRTVEGVIATHNVNLTRSEQIRKFRLLPHDLSEESGELTPIRNVKRDVVASKFRYLIDEMYD